MLVEKYRKFKAKYVVSQRREFEYAINRAC